MAKKEASRKKGRLNTVAAVRVVPVSIFNRSVVVMIGDVAGCEKALRADKETNIPKDILDRVFTYLRESLEGNPRGRGFTFAAEGDIYVYLRERDSAVCVHELYHAVFRIMEICDVHDEETGAYLIGYLYENLIGM